MPRPTGQSHHGASLAPDAALVLGNHHQFEAAGSSDAGPVESRMLLWCVRGHGEVTVDDVTHPLVPGAMFILPWGHRINYRAASRTPALVGGVHVVPRLPRRGPVEFRVRHHSSETGPGFDRRGDVVLPGLEGVLTGRMEEAPSLMHLAEYAVGWFVRGERGTRDEQTARSLGTMLLDEFIAYAARAGKRGGLPPALRRITEFVREQLHRPMSIDEIAEFAECSAPTVWRLFRRHLDATPVEWMQRERMERAAQLLATSALRVGEVGRQVGIDDPYYFTRLFGKVRGITPSEHRRRTALVE